MSIPMLLIGQFFTGGQSKIDHLVSWSNVYQNIMNENVAFWLVSSFGKNSVGSCLQCGSIRTHQKWRHQNIACTWRSFVSCLHASACGTHSSGEFTHNKATTSQIYKSWSLHYSNSARTWTGACINQNQKDWGSFQLNHKHSHSL